MSDPLEQQDDDSQFESFDESPDPTDSPEFADWGGGELEAAYLKAMQALEASDAELPEAPPAPALDAVLDAPQRIPPAQIIQSSTVSADRPSLAELMRETPVNVSEQPKSNSPAEVRLNPRQILEACLFVGGGPLAAGKLANVLRGDADSDFVDREIDELNRLYAAENRPYEVRLGEGGYRLTLRDEYERIRYKVFGLGPKEVRLSQESLEVLAVVAYHQPIKQAAVEQMGKPNCGAVLRQLVRRELLAVERDPELPRDVFYKTTARFLSLFGIRNLDELPRHEQVGYK